MSIRFLATTTIAAVTVVLVSAAAAWADAADGLRITEFMAINDGTLVDEDGDRSDWIEIHNPTAEAIDLTGWHLTDDVAELDKWAFPAVSLDSGAYLVVFASDKDRRDGAGELHTSFKLSGDGEYLALVRPDGDTVVHAYPPVSHIADVSYGLLGDMQAGYFAVPTPGEANAAGALGFVDAPEIDAGRGFYDAPFNVTITCPTAGAVIRYTTDGTAPSESFGTVYAPGTPIPITTTTTLLAVAARAGYATSPVAARTYIFLDDVIAQGNDQSARGMPATWVTKSGYVRTADYEMDTNVVNDAAYAPIMRDVLTAIPTLSIVMDVDDLFDQYTGIYANPNEYAHPELWERPASVEYFDAHGGPQFHVVCGARISGELARHPDVNSKYSFRLLFKEQYGPGKLEFPFFSDSDIDEYNTIVFRATYGNSWMNIYRGNDGDASALYIRNQFGHDCLRDAGHLASAGGYCHLYLNGVYWGLYNPNERPDDAFMAAHVGGDREQWDIIQGQLNYDGNLKSGSRASYDAMMALVASSSPISDAGYQQLKQYLDMEEFIDYIIINIFICNYDWPNKNWYAASLRGDPPAGPPAIRFRYFTWDNESTLGTGNRSTVGAPGSSTDTGPARIYDRVRRHPEFQQLFGDRVHRLMFNDGALTPAANTARLLFRADQIVDAVVGESARWGDWASPTITYTRDEHWIVERDRLVSSYFPGRTAAVLNQFRAIDLYPDVEAPVFFPHGGVVERGDTLDMLAEAGTIWYTDDGSDPRLADGSVSPGAKMFEAAEFEVITLLPAGSVWRYLDDGSDQGAAWIDPAFDDSAWAAGPAQLGYGDGDEATVIGYGGDADNKYITSYFRTTFQVAEASSYAALVLELKRDDGAVVYLNGHEILRENMSLGPIDYLTGAAVTAGSADEHLFHTFTVGAEHLVDGRNVLAVEIHQREPTSSDVSFDLRVDGRRLSEAASRVTLTSSTVVKARALDGGAWSALNEATYTLAGGPDLRVTEIMYHPAPSGGGTYDNDDFEFIEILNVGDVSEDLTTVALTDGVEFAFRDSAVTRLAPGERVVVVSNLDAFRWRYGDGVNVAGAYAGQLNNAGERIVLTHGDGVVFSAFTYRDDAPWPAAPDGGGVSLEVVSTAGDYDDAANWRAGSVPGGTPGEGILPVAGDADGDGDVDLDDFVILKQNFGTPAGATAAQGDFDGDGDVDLDDFVILKQNFGT